MQHYLQAQKKDLTFGGHVIILIYESEYEELPISEREKYVKEWKCGCHECRHVWHYLDSVENEIEKRMHKNYSEKNRGSSICRTDFIPTQYSLSAQLKIQKQNLKTCPKCGSSNVTRGAKYSKVERSISKGNSNVLVFLSVLGILFVYREWLKPLKTSYDSKRNRKIICSFHPSCSEYGILALGKYGFCKGWMKTIKRLSRCTTHKHTESCIDYP